MGNQVRAGSIQSDGFRTTVGEFEVDLPVSLFLFLLLFSHLVEGQGLTPCWPTWTPQDHKVSPWVGRTTLHDLNLSGIFKVF